MNKRFFILFLSLGIFLSGCALYSKNSESNVNESSSVSDTTDLGEGYVISLPTTWKVMQREEGVGNTILASAGTETNTIIQKVVKQGAFESVIMFRTFVFDAAKNPSEVQELENIPCKQPDSSEVSSMNDFPAASVIASSDFCTDGTGTFFRKYYTLKKEGNEKTLVIMVDVQSEAQFDELKSDFYVLMKSLTNDDIQKTSSTGDAIFLSEYSYDKVFKDIIISEDFGSLEDFFQLHEIDKQSTPDIYTLGRFTQREDGQGIETDELFINYPNYDNEYSINDPFVIIRFLKEKNTYTQFIIDKNNILVGAGDGVDS